ncbi:MAG: FAD-dependent oxidoreductase [Ignavibacterium sp.]
MKVLDKKYDYIIYPANFSGCVTAIQKSNEGAEVLLLNNYGFPGGEIAHSLCCHQFLDDDLMSGTTLNIYNQIIEERHGIFYRYQNQIVINPEAVKYVLQHNLEQNKIDLLFHVIPFRLKVHNSFSQIHLSAKEGEIVYSAKKIIDCSENFSLMKLLGIERMLIKANFNLFVSKSGNNGFYIDLSKDEDVIRHPSVEKYIQLFDLRFWVSLKIPVENDELFLENEAQKILNEYEIYLLTKGSRVQLIAPQTYRFYESGSLPDIYDKIFHVNSLIKENLGIEYTLIKSSLIEKALKEKINQNVK